MALWIQAQEKFQSGGTVLVKLVNCFGLMNHLNIYSNDYVAHQGQSCRIVGAPEHQLN